MGVAQRFHRSREKRKASPEMERTVQDHQFERSSQSVDNSLNNQGGSPEAKLEG